MRFPRGSYALVDCGVTMQVVEHLPFYFHDDILCWVPGSGNFAFVRPKYLTGEARTLALALLNNRARRGKGER